MDWARRAVYKSVVLLTATYQRVFLDLHVWGKEHIPPGPKIFVTNHITSTDVCWILPVFPERVHMVLGPGYKYGWMGRIWNAFEHISARDGQHRKMIERSSAYLDRGESLVIAPEGNLQELFQLGEFLPGVAAIHRRNPVPIVPMALLAPKHSMRKCGPPVEMDGRTYPTRLVLRGTYCINLGLAYQPDWKTGLGKRDQTEKFLSDLKQRIEALVEDARVNKFWLEKG